MTTTAFGENHDLASIDSALESPTAGKAAGDVATTGDQMATINLTDSPPPASPSPDRVRYQPPSGPSKLGFETGSPPSRSHAQPSSPASSTRIHQDEGYYPNDHEHFYDDEFGQGQEHDHELEQENGQGHAGPSHHASRAIPPPPNPRRHRSGILMSRVRAASSSAAIKLGASAGGSKSHGDLAACGGSACMDIPGTGAEEDEIDELDPLGDERAELGDGRTRFRSVDRDGWKRNVSEGTQSRKTSVDDGAEDNVWDNSARYYHHLHSRPASRTGSRSGSPEQSPALRHRSVTSPHTSPIYVRRNLTLPSTTNGPGPPAPGQGLSASLSPNHHFLQTHLPPTFSSSHPSGSSPEQFPQENHHAGSAMVFTPTTQEWKDLQATPEWQEMHGIVHHNTAHGHMDPSFSGSSSEDESGGKKLDHAHLELAHSHGKTGKRPGLNKSISAEYLGPEPTHTPDPGSPLLTPADNDVPPRSPTRTSLPVFNSVIIAPSPIMPVSDKVATSLASPTRQGSMSTPVTPLDAKHGEYDEQIAGISPNTSGNLDEDDIILADPNAESPARFASIGRRDSLRAIKKPGEHPPLPRTKTKRELEREKLLKMVDEELEADQHSPQQGGGSNGWSGGVQEIGSGLGLGNTPPISTDVRIDPEVLAGPVSADPVLEAQSVEHKNPFESEFVTKSHNLPTVVRSKGAQTSPTTTFKPSPLQASPVNAGSGLPTPSSTSTSPATTPAVTSTPSDRASSTPGPPPPGSNLATIRTYARNLQSRSRHPSSENSLGKDASPPRSPRSPRRRDTNRVSLVAGRVVQPFAIPPSTALPPPSRPALDRNISLQSFSPFRSPALSARPSSAASIPQIQRLDSTVSMAPSTGAPSECSTPTDETAGGIGGRGIDDYVILKEAGKGAYGLVMRAKVKGPKGEPIGEEVIIKYIIKARILADCWKKHKVLGPIPVEIHVMDQLRHLLYHKPSHMLPWDPRRSKPDSNAPPSPSSIKSNSSGGAANTPETNWATAQAVKDAHAPAFVSTQKYIAAEIKTSPERGHPNIGKLLDFFEDREFYYLVMPRFGTGLDLFDHVESSPSGLDSFEVRSLLGQLVDAVRFLHSNGIVHRDIKDENVILDGNGRCQLIDFGSAAHWRPGKRWDTFSGTLHYASPEILRGDMYGGKEQDVWALGVVGYVLLVGETPFSDLPDEVLDGLSVESRAYEVLHERCGDGHQDEGLEADGGGRLGDAADLVERCLELESADRPTAEQLVEHRYLKGRGGWVGKAGWLKSGSK